MAAQPAGSDTAATVPPSSPEVPLRLVIEAVLSDGEPLPFQDGVSLPRGWRNLEVRYAVPGGEDHGLRYRFWMEGFERAWAEVGNRTVAYYRNLPPGDYRLHIEARERSGITTNEVVLPVHVAPYLYETWWFWALAAALALLGALGTYRWQVGRVARRTDELARLMEERTEALQAEKERAEEALRSVQREREVAEGALATVEAQALQLLRMDHLKSRFFANVSHELRTPLTLVLDVLESADRGAFGPLAPPLDVQVHQAALNGRRLLRHINDLLDLARLEAGSMDLDPTDGDLVALTGEVVQAFQPLAEREHVSLHFQAERERLPVRFDHRRLEQVLFNLLSNALRATPEHGKVLVDVRVLDGPADGATDGAPLRVALRVQDTGSGIEEKVLPHLFDRFYQGEQQGASRFGSSGIGLSLVRDLVELHGGTIRVETVPGFGSTFTVELPLEPVAGEGAPAHVSGALRRRIEDARELGQIREVLEAATDGAAEETGRGPDGERPLVLVVEDHAEVRALLRRHLSPRFRVAEAGTGREALEKACATPPDLVLSDVAMPGLDGFELVRRLRRDDRLADVPIVLLTARASTEARLEGLGLGADDYLTKPFDGEEVVARVDNLIQSRRRLRARLGTHVLLGEREVPVRSADAAFLERVYEVAAAHIGDEDFTVPALAAAVGVSEAQLKRKLKALAGESPVEFIRSRRVERGAALLLGKAGTVGEVAAAVGFGSASYFAKCFRERYGVAPSEYAEAGEGEA